MYILDANIFIESFKRGWYRFDFHPAFWNLLDDLFVSGEARSTFAVYEELKPRGDDVWKWVKARKEYFPELGDASAGSYAELAKEIYSRDFIGRFGKEHVDNFARGADLDLIADARACSSIIVTKEKIDSSSLKISIPEIANLYKIETLDLPDFLSRLNVSFDSFSRK